MDARHSGSAATVEEKTREGKKKKKKEKRKRSVPQRRTRERRTGSRRERNNPQQEEKINQPNREKEGIYESTYACCNERSGEREMTRLMDYNIKEIDEQYRKASDNIGG